MRDSNFPKRQINRWNQCLTAQERGGAKQSALEEAAAAKRAAGGRVPPFQAAPVPPTLRQPAPLPPVAKKPPTAPQPFNLASEARHHEARVPSFFPPVCRIDPAGCELMLSREPGDPKYPLPNALQLNLTQRQ